MQRPDINEILVNNKSIDSAIFHHAKSTFPKAQVVPISTNTKSLDEKHGLVSLSWKDRAKQKRNFLAILHRNANWNPESNGRSTDFLPSQMIQRGCAGALCAYCYVDRHIPSFLHLYDDCYNFVDLCDYIDNNLDEMRTKFKKETGKDFEKYRDEDHNEYVTVDIGCDDQITLTNFVTQHDSYHGHIVDLVNQVTDNTKNIMLSFASKDADFSDYAQFIKHPERNRIRLSLMPEYHRKILELNTSPISDRMQEINRLVDMGFEVHVNLSPVVVTTNFAAEYAELLSQLNDTLTERAKKQLAYEIIFLTHDNSVNANCATFMPKAYGMMVNGVIPLVPKWNKKNVYSYSLDDKRKLKQVIYGLIDEFTPYSRVRYMF